MVCPERPDCTVQTAIMQLSMNQSPLHLHRFFDEVQSSVIGHSFITSRVSPALWSQFAHFYSPLRINLAIHFLEAKIYQSSFTVGSWLQSLFEHSARIFVLHYNRCRPHGPSLTVG